MKIISSNLCLCCWLALKMTILQNLLRARDISICTQNELLDLMARQMLCSKVMTIENNIYFAIMADKYTDKSNTEQLSFCGRTAKDSLKPGEEFLKFYELENIKSDTIV